MSQLIIKGASRKGVFVADADLHKSPHPALAYFFNEKVGRVIRACEVPLRECGPDEVILGNFRVGLCRTDNAIRFSPEGVPRGPEDSPMRLVGGHETVGQVIRVGKNVKGLKPGDWVLAHIRHVRPDADPKHPLYKHVDQSSDFENLCYESGIIRRDGSLTSYQVYPASQLRKLPRDVPPHYFVEADAISCVVKLFNKFMTSRNAEAHAIDLFWAKKNTPETLNVLLMGAGSTGFSALLYLDFLNQCHIDNPGRFPKRFNIKVMDIVDPHSPKAQIVGGFGAEYIQGPQDPSEYESFFLGLRDANNFKKDEGYLPGFDVVFDLVGNAQLKAASVKGLRDGGTLSVLGIPHGVHTFGNLNVAPFELQRVLGNIGEIASVNTVNSGKGECWSHAIHALRHAFFHRREWLDRAINNPDHAIDGLNPDAVMTLSANPDVIKATVYVNGIDAGLN